LHKVDAKLQNGTLHAESTAALQRHDAQLATIRRDTDEITRLVAEMKSEDGWDAAYAGPVTSVSYRVNEGDNGLMTYKIESTLVANVINLACVINEVQLYPNLFWFVRSLDVLEQPGRCQKTMYLRVRFFWPVADRDFYCYGYAVDGLDEDDCMLIYSRDLADVPDRLGPYRDRLDAKSKETVRGSMTAAFLYKPLTASTTKMTFIAKVDPTLPYVPVPLMNWFGKVFGRGIPKVEATLHLCSDLRRKPNTHVFPLGVGF